MAHAHFSDLTPGEQERLVLLQEECAEVIQIISKILRHGYESYHPKRKNGMSNRAQLQQELGHVYNAVGMLTTQNDLDTNIIFYWQKEKARTIGKYLHHQGVPRRG